RRGAHAGIRSGLLVAVIEGLERCDRALRVGAEDRECPDVLRAGLAEDLVALRLELSDLRLKHLPERRNRAVELGRRLVGRQRFLTRPALLLRPAAGGVELVELAREPLKRLFVLVERLRDGAADEGKRGVLERVDDARAGRVRVSELREDVEQFAEM